MTENIDTNTQINVTGSGEVNSELISISGNGIAETPPKATTEGSTGFLDMLSEEMRHIPALKSFKDVESLAKSYVNAQSLLGKKIENMAPEELQQILGKAVQAPDTPDGYKFEAVKGMDPDMVDFYRETAHTLKLSSKQAEDLAQIMMEVDNEMKTEADAKLQQELQNATQLLKKDWGNQVEDKVKLAKKAVVEFGGEELLNAITQSGLGNDPKLIRAFAKIGESLLESNLVGETGLGSFSMTPEQARKAISQKTMSKEFMEAYLSEFHPSHKEAVDEMFALNKLAYDTN